MNTATTSSDRTSGRNRLTKVFTSLVVLSACAAHFAVSQINVYFNRSIDSTVAFPGNVAKGNTNLPAKLIARIDSATYSIDMAMYSFDIDSVANHIVAAKNRGVRVRVVYHNRTDQSAITILRNNGIRIMKRKDTNGLMHNKFVVIDARDSTNTAPWVWTGSWNITTTQQVADYNNAIELRSRPLALAYTLQFNQMWGSPDDLPDSVNAKFGPQKIDNAPHFFTVNGRPVECYFSPKDGTTSKIIGKINAATVSANIGMFSFTRADIVAALKSRSVNAGVAVRGVMESIDVQATWDSLMTFARMYLHTSPGLFHHKYGIFGGGAGGPLLITGSHNWSTAAETANDENIVIVYDSLLVNQYLQEFEKRRAELSSTISGTVFNDLNGSGTKDPGEPGLEGWTVNLSGTQSGSFVTDASGSYVFSSLSFGTYTVAQVPQSGWTQTVPGPPGTYVLTVSAPTNFGSTDFGNQTSSSTVFSIASGDWSSPSTWSGSVVPGASNSVVISGGTTVTMDGSISCGSLTIGGTLQFDSTSGRTLTTGTFSITAGGVVRPTSSTTAAVTQTISVLGSFVNNGMFTSQASTSRVINVVFAGGVGPFTLGGVSSPITFNRLTMNLASPGTVLNCATSIAFASGGRLVLQKGTWVQTNGQTTTTSNNDTIPSTSTLQVTDNGAFVKPGASLIVMGTLRVLGGNLTIGNGNNRLEVVSGGTAEFGGGTTTIGGRLTLTAGTTTISGGAININPRGSANLAASSNVFEAAPAASLLMSDGSITIPNPRAATGSGREIRITAGSGPKVFSGGTIFFGDTVSTLAGSDSGFVIRSNVPLCDIVLQTGGTAGRNVSLDTSAIVGNVTLTSGTLNVGTPFPSGSTLVVLGNLTRTEGAINAGLGTMVLGSVSPPEYTIIDGDFTGPNAFGNLTLSNAVGVALGGNVDVSGSLVVSAGVATTSAYVFNLGAGASIVEPVNNPINGQITTTRMVSQNVNNTFGGLGIELNATGGSPGSTRVSRQTGVASGGGSVNRFFDISPTVNTGLNATLVFHYDQSELNGNVPSLLRLWSSSDSGATWQLRGGNVDTLTRRVTLAGIGSLSRWTVADSNHLAQGTVTLNYPVMNGWNLVSVPLGVSDYRRSAMYPGATSSAYAFDQAAGYVVRDTLRDRVGYWLKFPSAQNVAVSGAYRTHDTVVVAVGWNLIGASSTTVAAGAVQQVPPGIVASPYYGYALGYVAADSLYPNHGYWVKANQSGRLILK